MNIEIKILDAEFYYKVDETFFGDKSPSLPEYATVGAAAMDLYCTKDYTITPGSRTKISTGIAISINDPNVAAVILPRSGLGTRGLVLANTVGLIDSDYQGELLISAWNSNQLVTNRLKTEANWTTNFIHIKAGDRVAQLMFIPIIRPSFLVVDEFSTNSTRGSGGFGSTGND